MAATPPAGVCGPDITKQFATLLRQIQTDFRSWSKDDKEKACRRILIPLKLPQWVPGMDPKAFVHSLADIDGWDTLPLYQGNSEWLRDPRLVACPCASPTSRNAAADPFDDVHEDATTCSNSVMVAGSCWLNGTANYGTFGVMVRLCRDEFPFKFGLARLTSEALIRSYKAIGPHPEGAELPISWFRATYNGGPTGVPTVAGNRPQCGAGCPLDGSVVNWDYVWEPVKPRSAAKSPVLTMPPPPSPLPSPAPSPSGKTYTVKPGDSLSGIAQKQYGNPAGWPKIYAANRAAIGPNPNYIKAGQVLVIP